MKEIKRKENNESHDPSSSMNVCTEDKFQQNCLTFHVDFVISFCYLVAIFTFVNSLSREKFELRKAI